MGICVAYKIVLVDDNMHHSSALAIITILYPPQAILINTRRGTGSVKSGKVVYWSC